MECFKVKVPGRGMGGVWMMMATWERQSRENCKEGRSSVTSFEQLDQVHLTITS